MAKHYDADPVILVDEAGNPASSAGGANPNGQATMANSAPVVIASDQAAVPVGGTVLSSIDTKTPTVGQKVSSGSSPVVIASDQSTVPVSLTTVPTHAVSQSGSWGVTSTPFFGNQFVFVTTASTNAGVAKSSGGALFELTISNPTATAAYVKFYSKATAPTVGTDVPMFTIPIQANSTIVTDFGAVGKRITTGIAYAVTGAIAATDTTSAVAGIQVSGTYLL